jgi:P4 family phage/plasmid primase-like protien
VSGPYSVAAADYFNAGWSPIPFPFKTKFPPPDGYTGAEGKYVDEVTLRRWTGARGRAQAGKLTWKAGEGNIALRLHPNFIGIDVDMYDGKAGRETFAAAIAAWGPLPPTWYSSARRDGSGIRLFRIREGLAWPGKLPQGGGVELIRWDHRYAMCAPSIHEKTGDAYVWYHDDRGLVVDEVPELDDIPFLPQDWVEGLTAGKEWSARATVDMDSKEVEEWLRDRNDGKPCSTMQRTLAGALRQVRTAGDDGGSHDAARDGAWGLIGDAAAGHAGVWSALKSLRKAFALAAAPRRGADGERLVAEEWTRIVVRGVQKVAAEGEADPDDMCALLGRGSASSSSSGDSGGGGADPEGNQQDPGSEPRGSGKVWDFSRDDDGNAERLVHKHRHDMLFCAALGGWHVWNGSRWVLDEGDAQIWRWGKAITEDMESEASEIEEPAQRAAFMKFIRSSRNNGKRKTMIEGAAKMRGIAVGAEEFDGRADYLGVGNGTVRLNPDGPVDRIPAQQEHRLTRSTGVEFDRGATSDMWDSFLLRCQPDAEVRTWLQKLVGYSLQGGNPERLFIVAFGPTSTGKTTFMEAVRSALGDYGGPMNLSLLRDNQDERSRPDIVEALDKRFIFAEEASHEWKLHPDQIKRITGGTMLKARRPFAKEYIEKVPGFTPWLVTNSAPHIEGADPAFMRRLRVVPFDVEISKAEEVAAYRDQLCSLARPAVLAWCVRGWEMYREEPNLEPPAGALAALAMFQDELSDFDIMLREICDIGSGLHEKPRALYNAYQRWCEVSGVNQRDKMSETAFGRALNSRQLNKSTARVSGERNPVKVRTGLRLNEIYRSIVLDALPIEA